MVLLNAIMFTVFTSVRLAGMFWCMFGVGSKTEGTSIASTLCDVVVLEATLQVEFAHESWTLERRRTTDTWFLSTSASF